MTSIELKDRLTKAEEKVTKCENTIERHMKQLEKRQAKLLRVEWMAQYMEDLKAVMWDEEKRSEYKRATGDDLYWDCCDVQSKEEDIKGAKGYIAFSSDRDEFGILAPYIPCGGKRALQSILDAGGFCSFDGMEYVQELGA